MSCKISCHEIIKYRGHKKKQNNKFIIGYSRSFIYHEFSRVL